jgi:hypothetical protein
LQCPALPLAPRSHRSWPHPTAQRLIRQMDMVKCWQAERRAGREVIRTMARSSGRILQDPLQWNVTPGNYTTRTSSAHPFYIWTYDARWLVRLRVLWSLENAFADILGHRDSLRTQSFQFINRNNNNKKTPWALVRERTIPTERQPLVDEI